MLPFLHKPRQWEQGQYPQHASRVVTDADARERFLADPKAVLAAAGLDLPEWFTVTVREGDAAELIITVPALRDPDADLSDDVLEGVASIMGH